MKYFHDSYAIIELLKNNSQYRKYLSEEIVTTSLNIGEVYYYILRTHGKLAADGWFQNFNGEIVLFDEVDVVNAMTFKYEHKKRKISGIDALGYILSRKRNLLFLTGDSMFKGMSHVEFVK